MFDKLFEQTNPNRFIQNPGFLANNKETMDKQQNMKLQNEPKTGARRRKPSDFPRYQPDSTTTATPTAARAARLLCQNKANSALDSCLSTID
jgi:hypothetical protein